MLLCSLDDVRAGMKVGASVLHPARPDIELLVSGVALEGPLIARLRSLGVEQLWVHHDGTEDLDALLGPQLPEARRAVYRRIKQDFADMAACTISVSQMQDYRRTIMKLVAELMSNARIAGLSDQLAGAGDLFTHSANVAYLSLLAGIELQMYIVQQRARLDYEQARDLTSLGLGAMLHDIGKLAGPGEGQAIHEAHLDLTGDRPEGYDAHTLAGYHVLRGGRAAASATQVALNHHQRYDGSGWPAMDQVTRRRGQGPQRGEGIHVFSRIVAAANVLENLMSDAAGRRQPPVAALHALAGSRFEGWFDPVVRQLMLRRLPPFAVGTQVRLSDGRRAVVVGPSLVQPCRPLVRLLDAAQRKADGSYPLIDLYQSPQWWIVECAGQEVEQHLFTLPEKFMARARGGAAAAVAGAAAQDAGE